MPLVPIKIAPEYVNKFVVVSDFMFGDADGNDTSEVEFSKEEMAEKFYKLISGIEGHRDKGKQELGSLLLKDKDLLKHFWEDNYQMNQEEIKEYLEDENLELCDEMYEIWPQDTWANNEYAAAYRGSHIEYYDENGTKWGIKVV